MKLEQLLHLIAIVEHGSLRSAARHLDIPQPALTRSIRGLERELGAELFDRQTTGMVLTEAGRRFYQRACTIANETRRAKEEVQRADTDYEGSVSIALSIMPHLGMLPEALPIFRRAYPKVKINIIESLLPSVETDLRQSGIDFYLGAAPRIKPASGLTLQTLCQNTRVVVCRKGHPLSKARHLQKLSSAEWAATTIDHNAEEDLAALFKTHHLSIPKIVLKAHSALTIQVALAETDLLAMLPRQWTSFAMTSGTLDVIRVAETLPAPDIVLVKRAELPLSQPAEFFCDVLLRGLKRN